MIKLALKLLKILRFVNVSLKKIDGFIKSPLGPLIVIPAKAGIQSFQAIMDSCLRRNDAIFDFLRFRQD
jgi:hypothetical protein